ncbi:MAG: pirin family protein [Bacteroidales bacterium]|nr:pirin family protein [Bacteroidales bacterium]
MNNDAILSIKPMGFMLPVADPFLFCAHHLDKYPAGNDQMGPAASLEGRNLGQDFALKDGWRMYHGETVPGFPGHPHRGFETVTIVVKGLVDHADSHGQAGRYGNGDVQWMTAGSGLQHSEMFPLLNKDTGNTCELFQVWINLPRVKKFARPHFKMLWSEDIPLVISKDENGRKTEITIIAGRLGDIEALPPAPDSWAADPQNELAIWIIRMEAGAVWTLPAAGKQLNRNLYFYRGSSISINGSQVEPDSAIEVNPGKELILKNGDQEGYLLLLQGKPINEPVEQYGPFVMNTRKEIQEAFEEYRRTEFGGWPWPRYDQVHPREKGRFATHLDGTIEERN